MPDRAIREILQRLQPVETTLIICFYTGMHLPEFVAPMALVPSPQVNCDFGSDFAVLYASNLQLNPAAHDGAVMVGRSSAEHTFQISGWSHRMFPPEGLRKGVPNKGTAYNSCLAMSQIASVEMLYLQSRGQKVEFRLGQPTNIA